MKSYRDYTYQIVKVDDQKYQFDIYPPVGLAQFSLGDASNHVQANQQAKEYIDQLIAKEMVAA
jgi:hypothetical protein